MKAKYESSSSSFVFINPLRPLWLLRIPIMLLIVSFFNNKYRHFRNNSTSNRVSSYLHPWYLLSVRFFIIDKEFADTHNKSTVTSVSGTNALHNRKTCLLIFSYSQNNTC